MAISYPTSLDTTTTFPSDIDGAERSNALGTANVGLDDLLNDLGAAVRALEAAVGVTDSAVTTSIRYILSKLFARDYYVGPGGYDSVQDAIDAADAAYDDDGTRGVVFVGTAAASEAITLKQGVCSLEGFPDYSKITLPASTNGPLLTTDGFVTTDSNGGLYGFTIRNLIFDGNAANQASNSGEATVQIYGRSYRIDHVIIRNSKTWAFYSNWSSDSGPPGPDDRGMEAFINDLNCVAYTDGGINFVGPHDSHLENVICADLTGSGGSTGIRLGERAYGTKLAHCHPYGNGHDYALDIDGATGAQVESGQYEGAQTAQIRIKDVADVIVSGCKIYAAGTISAPVGIEIDGASGYLVQNNQFRNLTSGVFNFVDDDIGVIEGNDNYQDTGTVLAGTMNVATTVRNNTGTGSAGGGPGTVVTISGGVATVTPWCEFVFIAGEGAAADTLDKILPMRRAGSRLLVVGSHELTLTHVVGAVGQLVNRTGAGATLGQFQLIEYVASGVNDWTQPV
ncbi:MAG: right-handed parallel beta-helix repeat-containing protein [Dehalococcoidia bacterium]